MTYREKYEKWLTFDEETAKELSAITDEKEIEDRFYKDIAFGPKNMGLKPEEIDRRVREAAGFVGLTEEQLDALVAECSEKELFFLKPGLDYTSNLLHEITEKLYGSKTVEELDKEILDRQSYLLGENAIRNPFYGFTEKTIKSLEKKVRKRSDELRRRFGRTDDR